MAKDLLTAQHRKHIERCAKNGADEPKRIRLNQFPDKYNVTHGEPVDCADRIPICKARCCKFTVVLAEQDLDEGKLQWDLEHPYVLRRAGDGRCVYQERATGFCGNYEYRPAPCRWYSCKDDKRIWLDFENKIIAPPSTTVDDDGLQPAP
ncbi:MAG: YkgJ family cysteine cluster protein [Myxococcales bacterium]|nr:YkgJ family cysteine cluster protein [Myxococcales bacterium]